MRVTRVLNACVVTALATWSSGTFGYDFSLDNKAEADSIDAKSRPTTLNEQNRIYGGSAADISKYPFIASLSDSVSGGTFCAGTLIAPQYILTAGHCITIGLLPTVATFESNFSSVGEARRGEQEGVDFNVIAGFRHPLYNKTAHLYDIGLLKLEKPVKRPTAKMCAADGSDNEVGTMATVFGWGKTPESNAKMSTRLNELTVPIISNAECGKFERYVGRVTEGMLCAGTGGGRDTCNGDSGGPLLVNDDTIVGFVSWGSRCGEQAGIFTRLTYVMDYIEGIVAGGRGKKYGEVEPGSEIAQMIADAAASGSGKAGTAAQAAGADESGSSSIDIAALMKDMFGAAGKNPEMTKLLETMGLQMSEGGGPVSESDEMGSATGEKEALGEGDGFEMGSKELEEDEEDLDKLYQQGLLSDGGSEDAEPVKGSKEPEEDEEDLDKLYQQGLLSDGEGEDAEPVAGAGKALRKPSKTMVNDDEAPSSMNEDTPDQMDVVEQSDLQGSGRM
ncbi:unnamed protein product [Hyaloperonospora brassicae]|uniref:Peptidase S1 domain-containing protein n=1 Tax=Hyaloperonospora brassicae TaxID=162125 RepID=A0AAV0U2E6_HYABA|nr:unnamed protein product [Hyaloperonospora brassicae]